MDDTGTGPFNCTASTSNDGESFTGTGSIFKPTVAQGEDTTPPRSAWLRNVGKSMWQALI